jgi:serine/threonine-protein kinase
MDVALKFLPPAMNRDPVAVAELKREAVLAMRLSHKNIVRLHNIERENNRLFIVMEYVAGETLREVLQRMGPLSMASVAAIARACAVALDYAHGQHILHRDIKPENLMVDRDGQLKIVDFGIAVRVQSAPGVTVEGTPGYMSPEQLRHETPDARADVFSLGAVLCELLTGKRVFPDRGDLKRLFEFPPAGLADVPPPVRDVLARALDLDRERRWSSVREFYAALEQALTR